MAEYSPMMQHYIQTKEEYKIKQEEMIDFFDHKIEE